MRIIKYLLAFQNMTTTDINSLIFFLFLVIFITYTLFKNRVSRESYEWTLYGRKLNFYHVAFLIVGTLVGGASTIGTTQMAYEYGAPSLIFTFSSAFACLILGIFFSYKLRESESITVIELIGKRFGENTRKYLSFFALAGIFLQTVAQMIAASSIIRANMKVSFETSIVVTSFFIFFFIVLFGIKGASFLGQYKFYMLYIILALSLIIIFKKGFYFIQTNLNEYGFARGLKDTLSTILGVLSTQTYLQAIFAAKDIKHARNGSLLAALIIPPVGLGFYLIGIYMKYNRPDIQITSDVLPIFIQTYIPFGISSIFLVFIFIISIGTASGLFLGTLTMLFEDHLKIYYKKVSDNPIFFYRIAGLILIIISSMITLNVKSGILEWSFLSMGLRGSSIFLPLIIIIFNLRYGKKASFLIYALPILYIIYTLISKLKA
ncbi:sodium:solute symporter family transporter [Calditerrivibrio nitroreducens]|nr:hypothetical protein [Calditerrivibrio nitroreducens]